MRARSWNMAPPGAASYSAGWIEMTRPRRPEENCTPPGRVAKIVSPLPMPAPSPGLKRVPRWRTMISPPLTTSPAKTFTPSRFAFESRPLRLEPSPFLCATSGSSGEYWGSWAVAGGGWQGRRSAGIPLGFQGSRTPPAGDQRPIQGRQDLPEGPLLGPLLDARDLEPRELLTVPGGALVAALGLELEHAELRPALVAEHLGLHRDRAELRAEERLVAARVEQRLEVDRRPLLGREALDEEGRPLLDAVLLAARADDCVGGIGHLALGQSLASDGETSALARERRRPPRRPRRRGFDCTASSSAPPSASRNESAAGGDSRSASASSSAGADLARDLLRPALGRAVSSSASAIAAGPVPAWTRPESAS